MDDFGLDEHERVIAEYGGRVRREARSAPYALEWDASHALPHRRVARGRRAREWRRSTAATTSAAAGCAGWTPSASSSSWRRPTRPSRRSCPSTTCVRGWSRARTALHEQRKSWMPRLASMEVDRQLLPDRAGRRIRRGRAAHQGRSANGGDYVLDGVKQFISGAGRVRRVRRDGPNGDPGAEPGPRGISAFLVEKDTPGTEFRRRRGRRWAGTPSPPRR